eukprot:1883070-Rhodomonas_salina.1
MRVSESHWQEGRLQVRARLHCTTGLMAGSSVLPGTSTVTRKCRGSKSPSLAFQKKGFNYVI